MSSFDIGANGWYKGRFNGLYTVLANVLFNQFEITWSPSLFKPWF